MKKLEKDWLTKDLIDYEYKKYVILAYLKEVRTKFNQTELYPYLSDLVFHYRNLLSVKENQQLMYENFPKNISKADFENLKIHYQKIVKNDELMKELADIVAYAIPQFNSLLKEGKDIHEYIEEHIEIHPVGISPLFKNEGFFMMDEEDKREMPIYTYQLTIFESAKEKYRAIQTKYLETVRKSIGKTYEGIKLDLVRKHPEHANPATYHIYSKYSYNHEATMLPIAKRLLVRYISEAA